MNKKVKHSVVVYDGLTLGDLLDNLPDYENEDLESYFHFDYSKDEFSHTEVIVTLRYS